jgi:hypothetical protein
VAGNNAIGRCRARGASPCCRSTGLATCGARLGPQGQPQPLERQPRSPCCGWPCGPSRAPTDNLGMHCRPRAPLAFLHFAYAGAGRAQGPVAQVSKLAVSRVFESSNDARLERPQTLGRPAALETGATSDFEVCSTFISYSQHDEAFSRQLWSALRAKGLRVWYAPEQMQGGKKLLEQIEYAIHPHSKLLLVLSNASLESNWVRTEIRKARNEEEKSKQRKLFPIRLCDMATLKAWVDFDSDSGRDIAAVVRQYFIPDFSQWLKPGAFEREFAKLCRDLRAQGVSMQNA